MTEPVLSIAGAGKSFVRHAEGGVRLPVLQGADLEVRPGECVALAGPSGSGKSTLMRMVYGNYRCDEGSIRVRDGESWHEIAGAEPRTVLQLRRRTIGYVSQFLRVVPRVPTLRVVAEPLFNLGASEAEATDRAAELLSRLNLPERLWHLSPVTFSGGEQQRINVARGFAHPFPLLLLDEPTASLDRGNKQVVIELIREALRDGAAILGIFHDPEARAALDPRPFDIMTAAAA